MPVVRSHQSEFSRLLKNITYLAVNNGLGNVEFTDHAEGNGTTARLGIVKLTLEQDGVDALLESEDLGSAGSGRSSSDDGNLVLHAQGRRRTGGLVSHRSGAQECGGCEGGDGGHTSGD